MDHSDSILQIFNESGLSVPLNEDKARNLVTEIEQGEQVEFELIELVYVDSKEIVRINKEFLGRDYITDIISFNYGDETQAVPSNKTSEPIEGTLYCCAPRISEQAAELGEEPEKEFMRIFIHGLLHLTGYEDQKDADKKAMTRLENRYLAKMGFNK